MVAWISSCLLVQNNQSIHNPTYSLSLHSTTIAIINPLISTRSGPNRQLAPFSVALFQNLQHRPSAAPDRVPPTATFPFASSQALKMPGLVTATGVLAFLDDEEPELKVFALQTLNDDIDTVWTEVAQRSVLGKMYATVPSLSPRVNADL